MYCLMDLEARSPGVDNVGVLGRTCFSLSMASGDSCSPWLQTLPPSLPLSSQGCLLPACLSARGILLPVPLSSSCEDTVMRD